MNSGTTATPAYRGLFASLRNRLAQRPDSEHEQALIRLVIAIIGVLYVFTMDASGKLTTEQHHILSLSPYVILTAIALFTLIAISPQASPPRRLVGMAFDFSITSYFMYVMEDNGILFFPVYLWVTIGNGLRYGMPYLFTAMAVSMISFMVVIGNSAYWREQWGFSAGLLIGLVALPLYFSSLLKQLNRQNAELKKLYEQMARHATYDSLTNLPNRKHFDDHLAETIASAERDKKSFAVLYLDLDGFKTINDDLGHGVGDKIIEHTARRLEQCVRKGDFVARVGGDEFTILLRDITSLDVSRVAEKTIAALAEPFTIAASALRVTTSIGVATYPHDGTDANALIQNADSAMYDAKRSGKNRYQMCSSKLIQQAG
jgi:diguanylate cyclase